MLSDKGRGSDGLIGCAGCRDGLDFDFTMAFQPILDLSKQEVFAHEALVRGLGGEGAASILGRVTDGNRFAFDQQCRVKAVELASALRLPGRVSINFLPNAVYEPVHCLRTTIQAARQAGMPLDRIILEVTEGERISDPQHLKRILDAYKRSGLLTAIDDFGAGYAGLNLLAEYQPDIIKLDMDLVRGIDANVTRKAIVGGIVGVCRALSITVVAEGIETEGEMTTLRDLGVDLMQGFLFARPQLGLGPQVTWPEPPARPAAPDSRAKAIPDLGWLGGALPV
jgi:EAL domain-containing protein (putative c-di-GMP-specific phosphodiesterase class I)